MRGRAEAEFGTISGEKIEGFLAAFAVVVGIESLGTMIGFSLVPEVPSTE